MESRTKIWWCGGRAGSGALWWRSDGGYGGVVVERVVGRCGEEQMEDVVVWWREVVEQMEEVVVGVVERGK